MCQIRGIDNTGTVHKKVTGLQQVHTVLYAKQDGPAQTSYHPNISRGGGRGGGGIGLLAACSKNHFSCSKGQTSLSHYTSVHATINT